MLHSTRACTLGPLGTCIQYDPYSMVQDQYFTTVNYFILNTNW
jgi:hypothetical protein